MRFHSSFVLYFVYIGGCDGAKFEYNESITPRTEGTALGTPSRSLRELVRSTIAEKITNGELLPGDTIREQELCEGLGISRTPVREAMIELVSAKLLTAVPRKGFVVRELTRKEKQDVYDVIAVLDAEAAVCALERMGPEGLSALRETVDFIDVAIRHRNYASYCRLQQAFHEVYRQRCGNDLLLAMLREASDRFVMPTYLSQDKEALFAVYGQMNDEHRRIIELFEQGDKQALFHYLAWTHWRTQYEDMI